jgi:THO complex subunit 2
MYGPNILILFCLAVVNRYAHLLPKDEEVFEDYNVSSAKRFEEANKIGKINLAATGKDLMEDEKQGDVTVDLFAALDMESEAVTERLPELENNQTLGLLNGFLSVDDWYEHRIISFYLTNPLSSNQSIWLTGFLNQCMLNFKFYYSS